MILRILHLEGKIVNRSTGFRPIKVVVTKGHWKLLKGSCRCVCGQEINIRTRSILHRNAASIPTMEIRGSHNDRPFTIRAKDCMSVSDSTVRIAIHHQHRIVILVEERYHIVIRHGLSRFNAILNHMHDKTITHDDGFVETG